MQLFLNALILKICLPKGKKKKRKMKKGEDVSSVNPLNITSARGRGAYNKGKV